MDLVKEIADCLWQRRNDLGLSQEDVALEAGFATSTISRLESGLVNFQVETLFRWAEGLGLDMEINFLEKEKDAEASSPGANVPDSWM